MGIRREQKKLVKEYIQTEGRKQMGLDTPPPPPLRQSGVQCQHCGAPGADQVCGYCGTPTPLLEEAPKTEHKKITDLFNRGLVTANEIRNRL